MPRKYPSMQERIIENSFQDPRTWHSGSHCWVWLRRTKPNRAGVKYPVLCVRVGGKVTTKYAHRVSVEAFTGRALPPGAVAKHLCNNTLCVNPGHLQGGTQASNVDQALGQGRLARCPERGVFVTGDVY